MPVVMASHRFETPGGTSKGGRAWLISQGEKSTHWVSHLRDGRAAVEENCKKIVKVDLAEKWPKGKRRRCLCGGGGV